MCMETPAKKTNFIWEMIEDDLQSGRYQRVHTRFPPEPNGYLHIGHCKALVADFLTAERFGGLTNLRFDDTNPAKEETEFVEGIEEDIRWLGFDWKGGLFFASEYYQKCYDIAVDWIARGLAYVDEQTPEQVRLSRGTLTEPGKNSPWRDRPTEESLRLFEEMRAGKHPEGRMILRMPSKRLAHFSIRQPVARRHQRRLCKRFSNSRLRRVIKQLATRRPHMGSGGYQHFRVFAQLLCQSP